MIGGVNAGATGAHNNEGDGATTCLNLYLDIDIDKQMYKLRCNVQVDERDHSHD